MAAKTSKNVGWLTNCPASDGNFKAHLKRATEEEVRETLKIIEGRPNTKTKEKLLRAALKKKEAAEGDADVL